MSAKCPLILRDLDAIGAIEGERRSVTHKTMAQCEVKIDLERGFILAKLIIFSDGYRVAKSILGCYLAGIPKAALTVSGSLVEYPAPTKIARSAA